MRCNIAYSEGNVQEALPLKDNKKRQTSKNGKKKKRTRRENEMTDKVPIYHKYTLTIGEAAEYFRIGQNRLRQLVADNPDADYILMNGNRVQIKRKLFEKFIDLATTV